MKTKKPNWEFFIGLTGALFALYLFIQMPVSSSTGVTSMWGSGAEISGRGDAPGAPEMNTKLASLQRTNGADGATPKALDNRKAVKHSLRVQAEPDVLKDVFNETVRQCQALGCEVLESELGREYSGRNDMAGVLHAMMAPDKFEQFFDVLEHSGQVKFHKVTSEDKTLEFIDAEARIANVTHLRDRMRALLLEKNAANASLKDALEIERELSQAQTNLDAVTGIRNALLKKTSLSEVRITFGTIDASEGQSGFEALKEVWSGAGETFLKSLAWIMFAVVFLSPCILLIGVAAGLYMAYCKWVAKPADEVEPLVPGALPAASLATAKEKPAV